MVDILRQIYYGRSICSIVLRQIYYGRYITADILRQIYYGRHMMADILRHIYYGRYIKTDISRQISSARSSRLLHPNLFVATHCPTDFTGTHFVAAFMCKKAATKCLRARHMEEGVFFYGSQMIYMYI